MSTIVTKVCQIQSEWDVFDVVIIDVEATKNLPTHKLGEENA